METVRPERLSTSRISRRALGLVAGALLGGGLAATLSNEAAAKNRNRGRKHNNNNKSHATSTGQGGAGGTGGAGGDVTINRP